MGVEAALKLVVVDHSAVRRHYRRLSVLMYRAGAWCCKDEREAMRTPFVLALIGVVLYVVPWPVSAEELRGAARRAYEKATSDGSLSTSCSTGSPDFVFWAGRTPSTLEVGGRPRPVQFEQHKVGDYVSKPYQCQTTAGLLRVTTKLTHSISNPQCGAGNDFIAKFAISHIGSYSDDFPR